MRVFGVFLFVVFVASSLCDVPKGFIVNPADNHGYRIMYEAKPWVAARQICANLGAKLAIPKTKEQFAFIQKMLRGMHLPSVVGTDYKLLAWLGISNLNNYHKWTNIDGENIEDTGFHTWAGQYNGLISENPAEPHCVGMDMMNYGLRDWWCHRPLPYICEIQLTQNKSA